MALLELNRRVHSSPELPQRNRPRSPWAAPMNTYSNSAPGCSRLSRPRAPRLRSPGRVDLTTVVAVLRLRPATAAARAVLVTTDAAVASTVAEGRLPVDHPRVFQSRRFRCTDAAERDDDEPCAILRPPRGNFALQRRVAPTHSSRQERLPAWGARAPETAARARVESRLDECCVKIEAFRSNALRSRPHPLLYPRTWATALRNSFVDVCILSVTSTPPPRSRFAGTQAIEALLELPLPQASSSSRIASSSPILHSSPLPGPRPRRRCPLYSHSQSPLMHEPRGKLQPRPLLFVLARTDDKSCLSLPSSSMRTIDCARSRSSTAPAVFPRAWGELKARALLLPSVRARGRCAVCGLDHLDAAAHTCHGSLEHQQPLLFVRPKDDDRHVLRVVARHKRANDGVGMGEMDETDGRAGKGGQASGGGGRDEDGLHPPLFARTMRREGDVLALHIVDSTSTSTAAAGAIQIRAFDLVFLAHHIVINLDGHVLALIAGAPCSSTSSRRRRFCTSAEACGRTRCNSYARKRTTRRLPSRSSLQFPSDRTLDYGGSRFRFGVARARASACGLSIASRDDEAPCVVSPVYLHHARARAQSRAG
ncbi:hypothetical protein C8R45DRAFT_1216490 [Mycena sanguinolenta]|nr:hypothetical protein C8R45DRAFT_1216490 [Mycena sanguinolenta]